MVDHPTPKNSTPTSPDREVLTSTVAQVWNDSAVPAIEAHIAVPALSPAFDPSWAEAGHIDTVLVLSLIHIWSALPQ